MTIIDSLNLSQNPEWPTPQYVFDALNREFHFDLDVCANESNHKCKDYFDIARDGLKQDWRGHVCWMNPPYGKPISKWVRKAAESAPPGGGDNRSGIVTQSDRYQMVSGCNESVGDSHSPRETSVRRRVMYGTVRVDNRGMGNTPYPENELCYIQTGSQQSQIGGILWLTV